jgi:hypothetical protein
MKHTLILILKWVALFALTPFLIASLVLLATGDYLIALILFLMAAAPSFLIIRSFFKKAENKTILLADEDRTDKQESSKEKIEFDDSVFEDTIKLIHEKKGIPLEDLYKQSAQEITNHFSQIIKDSIMAGFKQESHVNETSQSTKNEATSLSLSEYSQLKRQGIQLLESIYIISYTKNLDILVGRIDFINSLYANFILGSKIESYTGDIHQSIDDYKAMYYNRIPDDTQLFLLLYPDKEKMKLFYSDCIVNCYERYVQQQTEELNKLKMNAAKERRREDIIKKGYSAKYMFKTYELPDNGHLERIEKTRSQFYHHKALD